MTELLIVISIVVIYYRVGVLLKKVDEIDTKLGKILGRRKSSTEDNNDTP